MLRIRLRSLLLLSCIPSILVAQGGEYRLGLSLASTRRNMMPNPGSLGRGSATMKGVDLVLRSDLAGLFANYTSAEFGSSAGTGADGPVKSAVVGVGIGPRIWTIEGSFYRRSRGSTLSDGAENMWTLGAHSTIDLGPSGFTASLAARAIARNDSISGGSTNTLDHEFRIVGWLAETEVLYQAPSRIPLFVSLGYRFERVASNRNVVPMRREELSGIVFRLGVRHLSRGRPKPEPAAP